MLRGFLIFFFGGLPKFFLQKPFRRLFWLGLKLTIFPKKRTFRIDGNRFYINDKLGFFWQYYEIFYRQYYRFNISSDSNPVIIDCGANIGLSAYWFLTTYPKSKVYCFEPDSVVFDKLSANLKSFSSERLFLINKAVYTSNGSLHFQADGKDGGKLVEAETLGNTEVPTIDFKEFLGKFERIDMLKIDIEGAEKELLPHIEGQLHRVNNIFIEYHQRENETGFLSGITSVLEKAEFVYRMEAPVKVNSPMTNNRIINGCYLQVNIFATRK